MEYETTYTLTDRQKEDFRVAYAGVLLTDDMLLKLRTAGEALPAEEAKNDALRDRMRRYAAAYEIDLSDIGT